MFSRLAVADTSVAISHYLGTKSASYAAVSRLVQSGQLLASDETLSEFREVLLREKFNRIPTAVRLSFIAAYEKAVTLIEPLIDIVACVDPKDDKFLSLAMSGNASLILTSDNHLLRLHPFRSVRIITPEQYLTEHGIPVTPR